MNKASHRGRDEAANCSTTSPSVMALRKVLQCGENLAKQLNCKGLATGQAASDLNHLIVIPRGIAPIDGHFTEFSTKSRFKQF